MSNLIRVLVVDDSAFMRKAICMMLESDPEIRVVDTARDGEEAIEKVRLYRPDIVTLDIEMPRMDGLTALRTIMEEMPLPVIMISALTTEGAQATLDALELGAVDFIPKHLPFISLDIIKIKEDLLRKVKGIPKRKSLIRARLKARSLPPGPVTLASMGPRQARFQVVAVGTSTGGPPALQAIIPRIPADFPIGILIVQHMPPTFTRSLAERLNSLSQIEVKEAEEGDQVGRGMALVAPGGKHMTVRLRRGTVRVCLSDWPADTLHKPSVDVMMLSVARVYGGAAVGVILTGMGQDGVQGLKEIKRRGGYIFAEDEESCVVFGMPKAAIDEGVVDKVVPLESIAQEIVYTVSQGPRAWPVEAVDSEAVTS